MDSKCTESLFNFNKSIIQYYAILHDSSKYKNNPPKIGDCIKIPIYSRYGNKKLDNPKIAAEELLLNSEYDDVMLEYRLSKSRLSQKAIIYKIEGIISSKDKYYLSNAKIIGIEYSGTLKNILEKFKIKYSIKNNHANSKVLESLLIPEDNLDIANEGLKDLFSKIIGVRQNNYNKPNKDKSSEFINSLKDKYNLNDEVSKKKFKDKLLSDTELKIKKMVAIANKDKEIFDKVKASIIKDYGDSEKELIKSLKPGYFTVYEEGDNWVIIEDQLVSIYCDLHDDIAESLNKLKTTDERYNFISFNTGDGDEGCVYYDWKYI